MISSKRSMRFNVLFRRSIQSLKVFVKHCILEGMEYEVIKGGLQMLKKYRPILSYETLRSFEEERNRRLFQEVAALLHPLGYELFAMTEPGRLIPVHAQHFFANTIALPENQASCISE